MQNKHAELIMCVGTAAVNDSTGAKTNTYSNCFHANFPNHWWWSAQLNINFGFHRFILVYCKWWKCWKKSVSQTSVDSQPGNEL